MIYKSLFSRVRTPVSLARKITLLIFPIALILLTSFFRKSAGPDYMWGADPSYPYLYNGLMIADGDLRIGHTDHPGSTLQVFAAVCIHITHIFRSDTPLVEDVLLHSELYLDVTFAFSIVLLAFSLWRLGIVALRRSTRLYEALFLQFILFFSSIVMDHAARVMTEPLIMMGGIWMTTLVVAFFYRTDESKRSNWLFLLGFAAVGGWLLATKVSSLPMLAIPFFLLPGWKKKTIYTIGSLLMALLFVWPIWNRLDRFFMFAESMATHTGRYGLGAEGVVDAAAFKTNFLFELVTEPLTTSIIAIAFLMLLVSFLPKIGFRKTHPRHVWVLVGLCIAFTMNMVLVAKHYSFHYLIPSHVLLVLTLWITASLVAARWGHILKRWFTPVRLTAFVFVLGYALILRADLLHGYWPKHTNPGYTTQDMLLGDPAVTKVYILHGPTEDATGQGANYMGWAYSGDVRPMYSLILQKRDSNIVFFDAASNRFFNWNKRIFPDDLVRKTLRIWIYEKEGDLALVKQVTDQFQAFGADSGFMQVRQIFRNESTSEQIVEVRFNPSRLTHHWDLVRDLKCDFERRTSDRSLFFTSDSTLGIEGGETMCFEKAHSGGSAIRTSKKEPGGIGLWLPAHPGNRYEVSLWREGPGYDGVLAIHDTTGAKLYESGFGVLQQANNGWRQIGVSVELPKDYPDKTIRVTLWYNGVERDWTYWDDLELREYTLVQDTLR